MGIAAEECNSRMQEANVNATYKYQMLHVNATERCNLHSCHLTPVIAPKKVDIFPRPNTQA